MATGRVWGWIIENCMENLAKKKKKKEGKKNVVERAYSLSDAYFPLDTWEEYISFPSCT